ncbi:MAG TPA: hypothetical protein VI894_02445 [Candidatus Nanoarchaeia archaeon]|nr:hypothetical protein [Candidatus Nanoarchaeia archaeon]
MTLQLIIVAVLVLIVLVVLIVIFSQRTGKFVGGVSSCTTQGGVGCAANTARDCETRYSSIYAGKQVIWSALPNDDCEKQKQGKVCCIPTVTS